MSTVGRARAELGPVEVGVAGAVSGMVTRLLCQPLDVAKIRLQLQAEGRKGKYRGLLHLAVTLPREEGVSSLWKGHLPAQALSVTYGLASFAAYESLSAGLGPEDKSLAMNFLCGGLGGCAGTLASAPFDVLRTRFVAQASPVYSGTWDAVVQLWTEGGPAAFYRGVAPAMVAAAPQAGLQFAFYSLLTSLISSLNSSSLNSSSLPPVSSPSTIEERMSTMEERIRSAREERISTPQSLSCGGLAGLASKTLLYPLDVVKKRLQVSGWSAGRAGLGDTPSYRGLVHCVTSLLAREGVSSLYKGFSPAMIKAGITSSIHFAVYERVCTLFILRRKSS